MCGLMVAPCSEELWRFVTTLAVSWIMIVLFQRLGHLVVPSFLWVSHLHRVPAL